MKKGKKLAPVLSLLLVFMIIFAVPASAKEITSEDITAIGTDSSVSTVRTSEITPLEQLPSIRKLSTITPLSVNAEHIAYYTCNSFYGKSQPEALKLAYDCDAISFTATCINPDESDTVTCHITDLNNNVYNFTFAISTDGSVTTVPYALPAGRYRVFATGNDYIEKDVTIIFSRVTN